MKLEKQIINLELAKRLKELGIKQESLFYFYKYHHDNDFFIGSKNNDIALEENPEMISAFTVAELGVMLPNDFYSVYNLGRSENFRWRCECESTTDALTSYQVWADTESNVRAKMLIYLLEKEIINIDNINARIGE